MSTDALLTEIELFLAEQGNMSPYYFGFQATGNGRLVERLREAAAAGRPARIWPETADDVRAYIRSVRNGANPTQRRREQRPRQMEAAE